ncbi:MAG: hypothetical protein LBU81_03055 [Methanosarcinales archaeon]|nr:hypothetical protein [Methanosarcinales archaeon]
MFVILSVLVKESLPPLILSSGIGAHARSGSINVTAGLPAAGHMFLTICNPLISFGILLPDSPFHLISDQTQPIL